MGKRSRKQKAEGFVSSQEAIERALARLDYSVNRTPSKDIVNCRAPSCAKPVERQYTRHGYCLACIKKATERKIRKRREIVELKEMYNDEQFGAF